MQCTVLTITIPNQSSPRSSFHNANIRAAGFTRASVTLTARAAINARLVGIAVSLDTPIVGRAIVITWAFRVFTAFGTRYSGNTESWFAAAYFIKACTWKDTIFVYAAVNISLCCRVAWKVKALL
jgi:hypothetical protein